MINSLNSSNIIDLSCAPVIINVNIHLVFGKISQDLRIYFIAHQVQDSKDSWGLYACEHFLHADTH